nr:PREDICTED: nucleoside diphosphate kinase 3-like [Lepisosteus oculatus]
MICLVLTIFANIFQTAWAGINERTFVAVKPDGVQRRLVGEITRRFEQKGFRLVGLKLVQVRLPSRLSPGRRCAHPPPLKEPCVCRSHRDPPLSELNQLVMGLTGPIQPLLLSRVTVKEMQQGCPVLPYLHRNVVHGSDSVESAQREISLWFRQQEVLCWEDCTERWIYE